ncbi:LLM class flavin-dependent oxidoreductase [Rhizorhabdus dicambivorans]|uniref:Luciferase-like monooxygenase n=1 Tax=Rhizorhabdus dicambivorans TaxID=1850238 RepID=A0A2A4FZI4_9SPHN|nr:LLM class flavin-dependent oxidoreductase [Rhizorhabdus dicambivorans]ATE67127.1 LLM class flavin-dependent oxidoreductase [Rhizorhabdus dicambivorans]PCE42909.1 LLM class flavin-dependent oxidoreductase [Rhizorhabdus dicambivorans]
MALPFRLSVLDQSPVAEEMTAAEAVRNTLDLARTADALGYDRYWMAEHHASAGIVGVAPEVLIGPVALATKRIRVGSGGIMLPHFSPFKIAETFRLLGAIAPGRIDLGLGRAPGSDQRTAYALQRDRSRRIPSDDFPNHVAELLGYLSDSLPEDHVFAPLARTLPDGTLGSPDPWMLGSSPDSARWAGELGLPYCIADFINSNGVPLADIYRRSFQPSRWAAEPHVMVASWAIAATDREEAESLTLSSMMMFAHLIRGQTIAVPSVEKARAWLADNPQTSPRDRRMLLGDGRAVRGQIEEVAALYGAQEVMLVNIMHEHDKRRRSYELVAEAFGMVGTAAAA